MFDSKTYDDCVHYRGADLLDNCYSDADAKILTSLLLKHFNKFNRSSEYDLKNFPYVFRSLTMWYL